MRVSLAQFLTENMLKNTGGAVQKEGMVHALVH